MRRTGFAEHGIRALIVQSNRSVTGLPGIIRGTDLQVPPHQEAKLVSCLNGRAFDVTLELSLNFSTIM